MEKLYTVSEICEILKVKPLTIYRWRETGKINVIKINGSLRVTQSELDRLLKGE